MEKLIEKINSISNIVTNPTPFWNYLVTEHGLVLTETELLELQNNAIKSHPIFKKAIEMRNVQHNYAYRPRMSKIEKNKIQEFDKELNLLIDFREWPFS